MSQNFALTREQLKNHHVVMKVEVSFAYDLDTPGEVKKELLVLSHILHEVAEKQAMAQLHMDGLAPTTKRDLLYGNTAEGQTLIRDSGWGSST